MSDETQSSGPASDTGNVLAGTTLGALLTGNGAAAGFSINYEALPQGIADLEAAADFFDDRAKTALRLANILPPGIDGVSVNAAAQLGKWAADDGVNNLHATLIAGAKQTRDLAQKLRDELKTYLQVEELNIPKASPGLPL
jgi:ABC-type transporter Mla subunit MlaD